MSRAPYGNVLSKVWASNRLHGLYQRASGRVSERLASRPEHKVIIRPSSVIDVGQRRRLARRETDQARRARHGCCCCCC